MAAIEYRQHVEAIFRRTTQSYQALNLPVLGSVLTKMGSVASTENAFFHAFPERT
jgi:hypothetical protein